MAHHVEAKYDDNEHLFLPPRRTLGFNPQLTLNDSFLAQSYIEAYDISYPEAIKRIEDEVREVKQHLENEGSYEFYDIGIISLNEEGKYKFEPCEAGILTPELYGLNSFEINERKQQVFVPIREIPLKPTNEIKEEGKIEEKSEEALKPSNSIFLDDDDDKTISIKMSRIRNIAVACITLLLFLFVPSPINNGEGALISKSSINTDMLYRIMPKDVVKGNIKDSNIKLTKNNTTSKITKKADSFTKSSTSYYTIVLCSKVSIGNATAYTEKLNKDGYHEAKVLSKGKSTKVIYGKYTTENQAYNIVNKLNNIKDFHGCWVMKVKN